MRFSKRSGDRATTDQPGQSEPEIDRYDGPERRGRPMSISTRLDLFFLSLLLIAAATALFAILPFALFGIMRSVSGG